MSRLFVLIAVMGALLISCSAPHENPLDPKSSRYHAPSNPQDEPDLTAHVYSLHLSRLSIETWSVIAHLSGPDGGSIDSAWLTYDDRPTLPLSETSDEMWSTVLQASRSNLGTFIGQPFLFTARDSITRTLYSIGPAYLFRWLEDLPAIVAPDSNALTGPHPVLEWQPYGSTFPIIYSAFMLADSGHADTIWKAAIPAGVTTLTVPDSIPDGAYRWTLTVSDAFDNSCSKEAAFVVSAVSGSSNLKESPATP
jgi:hypothetical protein